MGEDDSLASVGEDDDRSFWLLATETPYDVHQVSVFKIDWRQQVTLIESIHRYRLNSRFPHERLQV